MLVVELLRLGADGIHDAWQNCRKRRSVLLERFVGVSSGQPREVVRVRLPISNFQPAIQGNLAASAYAEGQNLVLEQRPEVEFLRIPEVRETEEKAVSDEVAGKVALQNCGLLVGAVGSAAEAVD